MARKKLKEVVQLNSRQSNPGSPNDFFQEQFIVCSLIGSPKAMKNPKYERLMLINGLDENQWFVHVSWLPGGLTALLLLGSPCIYYKNHAYVPFTAVEKETGVKLDNIRAIALKNLREKFG